MFNYFQFIITVLGFFLEMILKNIITMLDFNIHIWNVIINYY